MGRICRAGWEQNEQENCGNEHRHRAPLDPAAQPPIAADGIVDPSRVMASFSAVWLLGTTSAPYGCWVRLLTRSS